MEERQITKEEAKQRLYELYQSDCKDKEIEPTTKDFIMWLGEEGYLEYVD